MSLASSGAVPGVEYGGGPRGLLGRPGRAGDHAGGLVDQDEARVEVPGAGREDVEEGPGDGAAHRVGHDVDAREPEVRQEAQQVCRVPVDAVVVRRDAVGRLEVRHLLAPLRGRLPPPGDEDEVLARAGSLSVCRQDGRRRLWIRSRLLAVRVLGKPS